MILFFSFPKFRIQNHLSLTKWQHSRDGKGWRGGRGGARGKNLLMEGIVFLINTPVSVVPNVHYLISCQCLSLSGVSYRACCVVHCACLRA